MALEIFKEVLVRVPRKRLDSLARSVYRGEAGNNVSSSVNLILTTDRRLRKLNRDYRQKDKATDVLSFNVDSLDLTNGTFGEIYISVPQAGRQAKSYGASMSEELSRLVCHGLLHLFGYDHVVAADELKMKAREEHYLALAKGGHSK